MNIDYKQQLLNVIEEYLNENQNHNHNVDFNFHFIETPFNDITVEGSTESTETFKLLALDFDKTCIYITNIFLPREMQHKNIGKGLIAEIFCFAFSISYRLFIFDIVSHSFYTSMINRYAREINSQEDNLKIVEIIQVTDLNSHYL